MAGDDSRQPDGDWAQPRFRFKLQWGGTEATFEEVAGIDAEALLEYRHANSPAFTTTRLPGLAKANDVTMKRGVFVKDNAFWDWYHRIQNNTLQRMPVTIQLLDEEGRSVMSWTLKNAWPTQVSAAEDSGDGVEVAVGRIDIAFEELEHRTA